MQSTYLCHSIFFYYGIDYVNSYFRSTQNENIIFLNLVSDSQATWFSVHHRHDSFYEFWALFSQSNLILAVLRYSELKWPIWFGNSLWWNITQKILFAYHQGSQETQFKLELKMPWKSNSWFEPADVNTVAMVNFLTTNRVLFMRAYHFLIWSLIELKLDLQTLPKLHASRSPNFRNRSSNSIVSQKFLTSV